MCANAIRLLFKYKTVAVCFQHNMHSESFPLAEEQDEEPETSRTY